MFRFLIFIIAICLCYFAFNLVADYNLALEFNILNYEIQTSLFVFIIAFIALQFLITSFVKVIAFFINFPSMVKERWGYLSDVRSRKKLVSALAECYTGNKETSIKTANKIKPYLKDYDKNIVHLIEAEKEQDLDKKCDILRKLAGKKVYNYYANKNLAIIYFEKGNYSQSEDFALKAFACNNSDPEVIMVLIKIYGYMKLWEKMSFAGSKMQRLGIDAMNKYGSKISPFYHKAAKAALKEKNDKKALKLLETALEFKPNSIEVLNMFAELSTNNKNQNALIKVLKTAYASKPSFELARMYALSSPSSISTEDIYKDLAKIVAPEKYENIYFALGGYLGLPNKIEELKNSKK